MSSESPEQLFLRFLDCGDERALDALFRRCAPGLRSFALGLGLPRDRLDDLVHETMVTAVQRAQNYDASLPLLPWLKGILARKAASLARDEARRRRHQDAWAQEQPHHAQGPIEEVAANEVVLLLREAIAAVPERYRAALELHLVHGLPPRDVARRLGRLQATVRVHLHRGLQCLRRQLPRGLFPLAVSVLALRSAEAVTPVAAATPMRTVVHASKWMLLAACLATAVLALPSFVLNDPAPASHAAWPTAPWEIPTNAESERTTPAVQRTAATEVAAPTAPFTIQVVDADGAPVPRVGLCVEPAAGQDPLPGRRHVVTDAAGVAEIADLPWRSVRVRSDRGHEEYVMHTTSPCVLRCVQRARLSGTVVDAFGRPAAGAAVWLAHGAFGPATGGVVAFCDGAGQFALEHVVPGSLFAALGRDGVCAPQTWVGGNDEITLQLAPCGSVQGFVVDEARRPIVDAQVVGGTAPEHAEQGFPDGAEWFLVPTQTLRTDQQGRFGPLWLPAGTHSVHVRAEGHAPAVVTATIAANATSSYTIELPDARRLGGSVRNARGAPIAEAQVVFRDDHRNHRIDVRTDAAGAFRLDVPRQSNGALCVRAPGYHPARQSLPAEEIDHEILLQLEHQRALEASLAFAEGKPAAHFAVRFLTPPRSALDEPELVLRADEDGRFHLPTAPDANTRCMVRGPGDPVWHALPSASINTFEHEWRGVVPGNFLPTTRLRGRCLGLDDRPIGNGRVYLSCDGGTLWESARTDAHGNFAVAPLAPGEYTVFVESQQAQQPCVREAGITLRPGDERSLELHSGPTGSVAFSLLLPDNTAPEEIAVTIVGGEPPRRYCARTIAQGTQVLPIGDYRLYAMGEGFVWVDGTPFHIAAGSSTELRRSLEPAARRVLALQGPPDAGEVAWSVRLTRSKDDVTMGTFHLLPDAMATVTAWLPRGSFGVLMQAANRDETWSGTLEVADLTPQHAPLPVPLTRR